MTSSAPTPSSMTSRRDADRLRVLAERLAVHAANPLNQERRRSWTSLNGLQSTDPMILVETGGLAQSGEWSLEGQMQCAEAWARRWELHFLTQLYQLEEVRDDWVAEPVVNCPWVLSFGDYGVPVEYVRAEHEVGMGSWAFAPPIHTPDDLTKLQHRPVTVDREASQRDFEQIASVVGDILSVRMRFAGNFWWSTGMTWTAADLVGLENLMLWMVDEPDALHCLMRFLCDDMLETMLWAERERLLTPNNENDYIGSGSIGYSRELPRSHLLPYRLSDLWLLSESQETVGVGPDMFEEFIFPYQCELGRYAGLTYYGCCEPLHTRWNVVKQFPHLRKVSVSPWCDQAYMAAHATGNVVFCRKPNPVLISTESFDEDAIRQDLQDTINTFSGLPYEIAMKDVHTVNGDMQRLQRWVEIAREEIDRSA